ncbi:flagellar motor switch protein FliG [Thermosipho melanesiensis]|uniref:Flagellar motor switch protein FliG n=2 Tax=Thermosipho melanesiensis TaxID=46541 RepID=A6LK93_THEM4|nr:flagellar motor switch protein FliG [Thermosipho melanesiensis]ABR30344.1 flagellar motor switch protein FliG [Thermosipho melanesiensis BI429]APT73510.1 flagellar motor switch protein FliG [Thermosipho melanesiensis]OOC37460.1 flagellar motor switch protein FliG [Thermosipho melanesiensis]OOC39665.1 flagellar motor switch protein FliG [Thermosipho melanesiensis]OOC39693.1 flagellar motor switch protein FliG [Thermosipho melanesiensis]
MAEKTGIPGKRKAAILLVLMGPENAANVLKNLDEQDVELLTIEIANLGKVTDEEKEVVLSEFKELSKAREMLLSGGIDYAKEMLIKAFGPEKAMKVIERLVSNLQVKPFEFMKLADPMQIVNFLQSEHPQTIALVLSFLEPQLSAKVLSALPENIQAEVIKRIALLERASPDVVREIEKTLEKKFSGIGMQTLSQVGGVDTAAEIINNIDRATEKSIMEKLGYESPELAEEIRRRLFVFEDLLKLDDRSVQLVLREVDTRDLAVALKGASDELKEKIFNNMSKRAAQLLKDELEFMGPVRVKDVEEAQQKIINIVRRLEEAGEIVIARGGGEELIV